VLWKVLYNHRGEDKSFVVFAPNVTSAEEAAVSELLRKKEAVGSTILLRIVPEDSTGKKGE